MKAQVFKTSQGFDIINCKGELFSISGEQIKKIGTIGPRFKPSGTLLKKIPAHIKSTFFKLQIQ